MMAWTEISWAARRLVRRPGSSLAAVLILALSAACWITVGSVLRTVVLAPLPIEQPDRLVVLQRQVGEERIHLHSPADLLDLRSSWPAAATVSGSTNVRVLMSGVEEATYVPGASVTTDYLETLGAEPVLGEIFRSTGRGSEGQKVVAVSWDLWRTRLGADLGVIGDTLSLDGEGYRVVAVMPEDLSFLGVDLWFPGPQGFPGPPFPIGPELFVRRDLAYVNVLARLKPGVSLEGARAALELVDRQTAEHYPAGHPAVTFHLTSLEDQVVGPARAHLGFLWTVVGVAGLLACASVSGLLFARGVARADQERVQLAIGASRMRLVMVPFTESAVLAAIGSGVGGALSWSGLQLFQALAPEFPRIEQVGFDGWVALQVTGLALLTTVLGGGLPALRVWSESRGPHPLQPPTKAGSKGRRRAWQLLLVAEVACMVLLLVSGGILMRQFLERSRLELGFIPAEVLTTLIEPPRGAYTTPEATSAFFQELESRLADPEVAEVGLVLPLPFSGGGRGESFAIVGRPEPVEGQGPAASSSIVNSAYFRVMGIGVEEGRSFADTDRQGSPGVALVNRSLAARYWRGESPVGVQLRMQSGEIVQVVGVVSDVRHRLSREVDPRIYRPYLQKPSPALWIALRGQPVSGADDRVRKVVRGLDPRQPVPPLVPMDERLSAELRPVRYVMLIVGSLALSAVGLTGVGMYALLSFVAREEARELSIRLCLGANRTAMVWGQVVRGLGPGLLGIVVGTLGAWSLNPLLQSILGAGVTDELPIIGAVILLSLVCLFTASLAGVWRLWRLGPEEALRVP